MKEPSNLKMRILMACALWMVARSPPLHACAGSGHISVQYSVPGLVTAVNTVAVSLKRVQCFLLKRQDWTLTECFRLHHSGWEKWTCFPFKFRTVLRNSLSTFPKQGWDSDERVATFPSTLPCQACRGSILAPHIHHGSTGQNVTQVGGLWLSFKSVSGAQTER